MKYLNAINKISGIGSQKLSMLMSYFGNSESIWNASSTELTSAGINDNLTKTFLWERNSISPEKEFDTLKKEGVDIITIENDEYPALLREIHNPPYLLYIRGRVECLQRPMVAIVGSRKCTTYGKQATRSLAQDLASAGITVVSGLALGIDAIAHRGALDAGGLTAAVLGSSVERTGITPYSNAVLGEDIIRFGGIILSEYPVPTAPSAGTFPARNRIMAGISAGTLVIEAAERSGSLITANHALENNRDVFAVPGSIFSPQSVGTNSLIRRGAKVVTCVQDILEELSLNVDDKPVEPVRLPQTKEEEIIIKIMGSETLHVDRIIKLSKLKASTVLSALAIMEMDGMLKDVGGSNYIRL